MYTSMLPEAMVQNYGKSLTCIIKDRKMLILMIFMHFEEMIPQNVVGYKTTGTW